MTAVRLFCAVFFAVLSLEMLAVASLPTGAILSGPFLDALSSCIPELALLLVFSWLAHMVFLPAAESRARRSWAGRIGPRAGEPL